MGSHGFIPSLTHRVLFFLSLPGSLFMVILPLSLSPSSSLLVAVQHQCIIPLLYPFLIDSVSNWSRCCARHPQAVEKSSRRRTDHVLKLAGSRSVEKLRAGERNGTRRTPSPGHMVRRGIPQGDACGVRSYVVPSCCEEARLCQKRRRMQEEQVLGEEPDADPGSEMLKRLSC